MQPKHGTGGLKMDKNLRDRVEKIAFDCLEEEIAEMEWLKDGCHKIATALCSLFAEREIEIIDDLVYAVKHTSFCKCDVCKVINKLKDKKGIEQ